MPEASRHDAWQGGDSYDRYMGRWSRQVAPLFLEWLAPEPDMEWLDVGCGTGALSATILDRCAPASVTGVDPSAGFVAKALQNAADPRAQFVVGDAQALPAETASRDATVAALVLNFVPDRAKALSEMNRVTRRGGLVAFYVWDYPNRGVEFMQRFWTAAAELDPRASEFFEYKRFPFCVPEHLLPMAAEAGMSELSCERIEIPTVFRDFDDFWEPFTLGAGPAPGYCRSLQPEARERLRTLLRDSLPAEPDGSIHLKSRAWAVKGTAA